jgi:hypothetical protein
MLTVADLREILATEYAEAGYSGVAKGIRAGSEGLSIMACLTAMSEVQKRTAETAFDETKRLLRMLKHIADEDYDAGYTAEDFARYAMDPKFDEGDVGGDTK